MDFFETPLQNRPPQCLAHSGFKTEQCNETLNALNPFKTVFFSTGCANVMAMCNKTQQSWCNGAQNATAHNGAAQNCPADWGTRFLNHPDSGTIKT